MVTTAGSDAQNASLEEHEARQLVKRGEQGHPHDKIIFDNL